MIYLRMENGQQVRKNFKEKELREEKFLKPGLFLLNSNGIGLKHRAQCELFEF